MPIYEYICQACGSETEIMHKISDPPARKCPACGKLKLSKQISAAGFRLSGRGWYETDFKKDGKRNLAGDKGAGDKEPAKAEAAKPAGESKSGKAPVEKKGPAKKGPQAEPKKAA